MTEHFMVNEAKIIYDAKVQCSTVVGVRPFTKYIQINLYAYLIHYFYNSKTRSERPKRTSDSDSTYIEKYIG